MAEHTPGPWRVESFRGSRHSRIQPEVGIFDGGALADVYGNKANAHLIAAAPDLLAALKAVEFMSGGRPRCPMCAGWDASPNGETDNAHSKDCQLAAAIKKAEGR